MFVRKKRNRTGTISVVVVDKRHGYKEVKNFGVVSTEEEADVLCASAREWIQTNSGQLLIDFGCDTIQAQELEEAHRAFANIDSVFMNALQLILNPIYEYHSLWVVEKAFRITKGNLEARSIFHFTSKRIEAHICICFIAYKVYKELERIMKLMKFPMSVDKALEIAKTIPTITIKLPHNQQKMTQTLFLTDEQRTIKPLFDLKKYFG